MAMPPEMPMGDEPLEGGEEMLEDEADPMALDAGGELDPQFAADVAEAFPDLDDAQLTALQRAFMGLMVR